MMETRLGTNASPGIAEIIKEHSLLATVKFEK
jgi:hypothetical protein